VDTALLYPVWLEDIIYFIAMQCDLLYLCLYSVPFIPHPTIPFPLLVLDAWAYTAAAGTGTTPKAAPTLQAPLAFPPLLSLQVA